MRRCGSRSAFAPSGRWVCGSLVAALGGIALVPIGCRDTEPPPVLYVDLGDAGRPLPPPAGLAWVDPSLKSGRAEWQAFREPSAEAMSDAPVAVRTNDEAAPSSNVDAGKIESEIRAMLADYNALAAENKTDELIDYHVKAQVERLRSFLNTRNTLVEKMSRIEQALRERLPNDSARIAAVFEPLQRDYSPVLEIGTITVQSDTSATGTLIETDISATIGFEVEDDAWYVEFPDDLLELIETNAAATLPALDQLQGGLDSGQIPADLILASWERVSVRSGGDNGAPSDAPSTFPSDTNAAAPSAAAPVVQGSSEPTPETLKAGADAYTSASCFKCHGADGTGGPRAPDLTDNEWVHCDGSIEGILGVLRTGVPQGSFVNKSYPFAMNPATESIQDDATLMALATYVHSLSK